MKKALSLFVLSSICLLGANMYAQVTIGADYEPARNAVLQVVKADEGKTVIVPELTSGEGNAIVPDNNFDNGMFYYNSSTGCFSYYNAAKNQWYNLCGTPPPAQGMIIDCGAIKERGIYIAGTAFITSNYLSVPVTITSPGTYEIIANTSPDNGYYFQASGIFPNAGTYVVNLMGQGTPVAAQTDHLEIFFNGVKAACDKTIAVQAPNPSYRIISAAVAPPFYPTETQLNDPLKYFVSVTLQVSIPGEYQLVALDRDGVGFSSSGQIEDASGYNPAGNFPQIVTVQIPAHGNIPSSMAGSNIPMNMTDLNSATPSNVTFTVQVAAISFGIDCGNTGAMDLTSISGANKMKQNQALGADRQITVPVIVSVTGTTTIHANVAGVDFISAPNITLTQGVTNNVVLTASGSQAPNAAGLRPMSFSSEKGGLESTCTVNIDIESAYAHIFSLTPNPPAYNATITKAGTVFTAVLPNVTLNYNCTMGGNYTLSATSNGVTFAANGSLLAGTGVITLIGAGTPLKNGTYTYTINYDSDGDNINDKTASFTVTYAYRTIKILGLCGVATVYGYAPNNNNTDRSSYKILHSAANFGPNGTFPTSGITTFARSAPTTAQEIKSLINNNKIDIIFIGYNYTPNAAVRAVLKDFVDNKKGVLFYASEDQASSQAFFTDFYGTTGNVTMYSDHIYTLANLNNPLLNGIFGDIRNKYAGVDVGASATKASSVPPAMTVIGQQANGNILIAYDAARGVVWCGDAGWLSSESYNILSSDICPLWINQSTGAPISDTSYSPTVENSFLYANAVAWAIEFIMQHIDEDYIMQ